MGIVHSGELFIPGDKDDMVEQYIAAAGMSGVLHIGAANLPTPTTLMAVIRLNPLKPSLSLPGCVSLRPLKLNEKHRVKPCQPSVQDEQDLLVSTQARLRVKLHVPLEALLLLQHPTKTPPGRRHRVGNILPVLLSKYRE